MNINKFTLNYNLGKTKKITKLTGGLMHKMFKVETDKGVYAIKVLNQAVMSRREAINNFVISESISNLVKDNGILVSNALFLNGEFINKLDDSYYMVFNFLDGKTLNDREITLEHCKKIGSVLADVHNIDYSSLNLDINIKEDKFYVDWEKYINYDKFDSMEYRDLYLENYHKYYSILKRVVESFNLSNKELAICHMDMDPKNVMWDKDDNPIIIDWESATLSNPFRELIEVALSWSGFLSNSFDIDKFKAVILEYTKKRPILHDRYITICGNLIGRFGWLDYNLKRSLGIVSNDLEEMELASNEVLKSIDEINRYLELIGTMYSVLCDVTKKEIVIYNDDIVKIIDSNELLRGEYYTLINKGFTNTIYKVGEYIVKIYTNKDNEKRFLNEIDFYNMNKGNDKIPTLYFSDVTKDIVPYYYQIINYIEGVTLYDIWYKLSNEERKDIVVKIVDIVSSFHSIVVDSYDFNDFIKNKIRDLLINGKIVDEVFDELLIKCDIFFKDNIFGFIHNDLHFDNFIYCDGELKLIDFERNVVAPIDYEFRIFNRCSEVPWKWASSESDLLAIEDDYSELMSMIIENYDKLRNIPYLNERLITYQIIDELAEYVKIKDAKVLDKVKKRVKEII